MKIDLLVAEIGSTTTIVNAFDHILTDNPKFLGSGSSYTTVLEGDVNIGLKHAINNLKEKLKVDTLEYIELFATSSAAGGLRMTVHGLVKDMTAKAGYEAAIGAGANIIKQTVGKLDEKEIKRIEHLNPNIILVAGGVDYGETETALHNAKLFAHSNVTCPIIYAGNIVNHDEVLEVFEEVGKRNQLTITENVYPEIDHLNVEPLRVIIHDLFEKHIMNASGMEHFKEMLTGSIMPTPGAILNASKLLYDEIGDLICFDIGGATTDLHSVTESNDEMKQIAIAPEPFAKRTVEGDLGVFVNFRNVLNTLDRDQLCKSLHITDDELDRLINEYTQFPKHTLDIELVKQISKQCLYIALNRHAGELVKRYTSSGVKSVTKGKDLTNVKYVIGTGGPLTQLPFNVTIMTDILQHANHNKLYPPKDATILIDHFYIMASMGVVSKKYPAFARMMLKKSLQL